MTNAIVGQNLADAKYGHESHRGLDVKTDWLTDRQSWS